MGDETGERTSPEQSPLAEIYNFRQLTAQVATAGQPTREQMLAVAGARFEVVINLAWHETESALPDERAIVEAAGMAYEHIPVPWEAPELAHLRAFFDAMDRNEGRRVFVHCVANFRASAFMMLYRVKRLGWKLEDASPDMEALWEPYDQWQRFVEAMLGEATL